MQMIHVHTYKGLNILSSIFNSTYAYKKYPAAYASVYICFLSGYTPTHGYANCIMMNTVAAALELNQI